MDGQRDPTIDVALHHDRRSPPLAEITEWEEESNGMVTQLRSSHTSLYKAASEILKPNTQYTIVAAGYIEYRDKRRWHYITEDGVKIQGGDSLRKIWDEWRKRHLGDEIRVGTVNGVPWMRFEVIRKVRSQGTNDFKCKLV